MVNTKGEKIIIKNQNKEVILFNLKQISNPLNSDSIPNIQLSINQRLNRLIGKKVEFAEHAVLPEERYVFVGNIKKNGPNFEIYPRLILADSKSHFLQHLDKYLVDLNGKGKKTFGAAIGILAVHFVIFRICFPQKRRGTRSDAQKE